MMVFDDVPRTDATPARHDEGRFAFLNRSASRYFQHVRDLVEEWFSHLPEGAKNDLRGALRSDDRQSDSAFWELYLHEAYLRSGYHIEVHPELTGVAKHPDFRMTRGDAVFYVEAVSVGQDQPAVAEDRRLKTVHQILAELQVEDFALELSTYSVGPQPLATKKLRRELQRWIADLDFERVGDAVQAASAVGLSALPSISWEDMGWVLVFHALPLRQEARGRARSALGMLGPGEAQVVDNVTGISRVLDSKKEKYGQLDAPLIIAVLSNTPYPTRDYEVEQALFGLSAHRPHESIAHPESLVRDGLWLTRTGWRYGDIPQVLTVQGLKPWYVTKVQPRLWETLEPGAVMPGQPAWLARMDLTVEARPLSAPPMAVCFGLADDWPGMIEPDFDLD